MIKALAPTSVSTVCPASPEFRLYFAIPIKAKYFVGAYLLLEIYQAIQNNAGDSTAHLAHIGGAIVGGIIVLIWRKTDRTNFY